MRILHIIAGAKPEGAGQSALDAVLALAEAGLEQHVVTREGQDSAAALKAAGVAVKRAGFDKKWRDPTKVAIRDAAQKFRPDIVQYWTGRAAMFAPKALRARGVGWHGGFHKLARFKNCDWHIAASRHIAERVIKEGAPGERVDVVAPFAETPAAAPADRAAMATPDSAHVVLAFARPNSKKGMDTLVAAIARMPGVYLWVAGDSALEPELRKLAEEAEITDRARFANPRFDRAALLAACDAVAAPARLESSSHVAAEAWLAGRPLVASDGAAADIGAADGVDVLLAPRDDPKVMSERLARVLEDAELARRLIENGARAYEAHYSRTAFLRGSMALYERVRQNTAATTRKSAA
jgi:glycosyltransferase involved in cell wall biosynthesis